MAPRPFRFGVNVWGAGSRGEWIDKARKIEALGYSVLTMPDHLGEFFAPLPALMSAAAATTHLRVGTNVLNNDFRHPVIVAREAATADVLTDGRLQLGLGAGHMKSEYDEAGLPFDAGATRVERLAEAVTIVKGLLAGEAITFTGRHYRVTGHKIHPLPIQRPHPPILIGGNGRRLLALAAKEADIVGLSGITFRSGGVERDLSGWRTAGVDAARAERAGPASGSDRQSPPGGRGAREALAAAEPGRDPGEPLRPDRADRAAGRGSSSTEGAMGHLLLRRLRAVRGRLRPGRGQARG